MKKSVLINYPVLMITAFTLFAAAELEYATDVRRKDLDGHSRIDRFSGIVDMGAYERLNAGIIFRAW